MRHKYGIIVIVFIVLLLIVKLFTGVVFYPKQAPDAGVVLKTPPMFASVLYQSEDRSIYFIKNDGSKKDVNVSLKMLNWQGEHDFPLYRIVFNRYFWYIELFLIIVVIVALLTNLKLKARFQK